MSKTESLLVGVFLCLTVPFVFFVVGWWGSAGLYLYHVIAIPEKGIAVCAFAGLALGIALTLLFLKRWVAGFYAMPAVVTVAFYLFWFAVMTAFFMGVPIGNVALGALVGLYVGRKARLSSHCEPAAIEGGSGSLEGGSGSLEGGSSSPEGGSGSFEGESSSPEGGSGSFEGESSSCGGGADSFHRDTRNAALFTAAVTAGAYVFLGILAVQEQHTLRTLLSFVGVGGLAATSAGRIGVVALAVPALALLEYHLTRVSAHAGYRLGAREV